MNPMVAQRDERTLTVENASYRWAYLVLSFGLLLDVAYRSFTRQESAWDLLALVLLGGAVATAYQGRHQVLTPRWAILAASMMLVAGLIAAGIVLLR
jgi:hypothetical protein